MLNRVSALTHYLVPGRFGVPGEAGVIMQEIVEFNLHQFAAWPETLTQTGNLAAHLIGAGAPPGPGQMITAQSGILMRIEPLKWWLQTVSSEHIVIPKPEPEIGSVLDVSNSRTCIRITGDKTTTLLHHFLAVDLRPSAFSQNSVISTAFHHIGVSLTHNKSGYDLFLPRSFAVSLWELLYNSALQYGLEVRRAMDFGQN